MSARTFFEMAVGEAGETRTSDGRIIRTGDKSASLTGHWPKELLDQWRQELRRLDVEIDDRAVSY